MPHPKSVVVAEVGVERSPALEFTFDVAELLDEDCPDDRVDPAGAEMDRRLFLSLLATERVRASPSVKRRSVVVNAAVVLVTIVSIYFICLDAGILSIDAISRKRSELIL